MLGQTRGLVELFRIKLRKWEKRKDEGGGRAGEDELEEGTNCSEEEERREKKICYHGHMDGCTDHLQLRETFCRFNWRPVRN